MKFITIIAMTLVSLSAFAKVEIHCELYDSGMAQTRRKSINQRIQELENAGNRVTISHLTSAIGGANNTTTSGSGQSRRQLNGRIRHEKCASLEYSMNGPR